MKIKFLKLVLPVVASLGCLSACGGSNSDDPSKDPYYQGYDLTLKGSKLASELQRLCFNTHSIFVKYKDYKSYASFTTDHLSSEAAPSTVAKDENGNYIIGKASGQKNEYFYTGKISTGVGTREHVWPCANSANLWVHDSDAGKHYVDGTNYKGGGSDLYHVRPSTDSVNTARGNSKFCDFDDPEFADIRSEVEEFGDTGPLKIKIQGFEVSESSGKPEYATRTEVDDSYKGDIARILVYVWVHYGYRGEYYNHEDMIGRLDLTNVMAYSSQARVYQKLIEWNEMDPPSETEKLRNDTVQKMQGNRNPFVDYPNLLKQVLA